jgi:hypothetical protein
MGDIPVTGVELKKEKKKRKRMFPFWILIQYGQPLAFILKTMTRQVCEIVSAVTPLIITI